MFLFPFVHPITRAPTNHPHTDPRPRSPGGSCCGSGNSGRCAQSALTERTQRCDECLSLSSVTSVFDGGSAAALCSGRLPTVDCRLSPLAQAAPMHSSKPPAVLRWAGLLSRAKGGRGSRRGRGGRLGRWRTTPPRRPPPPRRARQGEDRLKHPRAAPHRRPIATPAPTPKHSSIIDALPTPASSSVSCTQRRGLLRPAGGRGRGGGAPCGVRPPGRPDGGGQAATLAPRPCALLCSCSAAACCGLSSTRQEMARITSDCVVVDCRRDTAVRGS